MGMTALRRDPCPEDDPRLVHTVFHRFANNFGSRRRPSALPSRLCRAVKKRLPGAHAGPQNRLSLPLPRDSPRSVNTVMSDKPPPTSFSTDFLQAASAERRPSKEALS